MTRKHKVEKVLAFANTAIGHIENFKQKYLATQSDYEIARLRRIILTQVWASFHDLHTASRTEFEKKLHKSYRAKRNRINKKISQTKALKAKSI